MSDYDNTDRGVLFVNDRKQSDRHPDMKGKLNIDGTEFWLSGWWKDGKNGEFLSISLGDECEQKTAAPAPAPQPARGRGRPAPAPAAIAPIQPANRGAAPSGFEDFDDAPF